MKSLRLNNRGSRHLAFTLLEVLMALVVFSGGLLAVFPLLQASRRHQHTLWERYRAMGVAAVLLQTHGDSASPGLREWQHLENNRVYTVTLRSVPDKLNLRALEITVGYPVPPGTAEVRLSGVRYDETP